PDPGSYGANFCWSSGPRPLDAEPGQGLTDPTCQRVNFDYGRDSSVRYEIEDESTNQPKETTFRLHNDSENPISIRPPSSCTSGEDDWIRLQDGQGALKKSSWCGDCRCNQVSENGSCSRCKAACSPTPRRILAPGETAEFTWSGVGFRQEEKHGTACYAKTIPPVGERLDAAFCWRKSGPTADAKETQCKHLPLVYGEDQTLEHTVESDGEDGPTFKLVNDSGQPIRDQKNEGCTKPAWLDFAADSVKATEDTCGLCKCQFVEENGSCPVCAAGACRPPQVER
ncbi:MAG: hypothetical protein ABEK29_08200, partial [Bradymonadaceae bacterium]